VKLNALLERDAHLSRINETLFEERLNELEEIEPIRGTFWDLTFARINELQTGHGSCRNRPILGGLLFCCPLLSV